MQANRIAEPKCRRGYVLLMVLAVSVLVVTVLASLAKMSLRRGLQAADAERQLQQRWGAQSLQEAVLKQAPKIFALRAERQAELKPDEPLPTTIRTAMNLGGVTFDLMLADEDAKLNLNALYHHVGKMKTEQALAKSVGPLFARAMALNPASAPMQLERQSSRLRQDDDDDEEEARPLIPDAFRSWGEVFDVSYIERMEGEAALPNLTTGITCWGGGQLNFRRASDEAFLAIAGSVIQDGAAKRMLTRYRDNPLISGNVLLEAQVTNRSKRERLTRLLSEVSTNYSLWIHASIRNGTSMQRFVVMSIDDEGVTHYEQFAH